LKAQVAVSDYGMFLDQQSPWLFWYVDAYLFHVPFTGVSLK
jgi:hypothetical protein